MMTVINFLTTHKTEVFAVLFAISEALSLIPQVQSNSIFQLIFNWVKKLAGK